MESDILVVTVQDYGKGSTYDFCAYEFGSGLILVSREETNDWFFNCREEIEANGLDQILYFTETEESTEWSLEELQESIKGSLAEFGSVPELALSLLEL